MKKIDKLRALSKALSPDKVDFSAIDNEVAKLKKSLEETVNIQTVDDVSRKLKQFQDKIDFGPLMAEIEKIRMIFIDQAKQLEESITAKNQELISANEQGNAEQFGTLSAEIFGLKNDLETIKTTSLSNLSDFTKQIAEIKNAEGQAKETLITLNENLAGLSTKRETAETLQKSQELIDALRKDIMNRLSSFDRGGSMNQRISVNGTVMSTKFADINLIGSITAADNRTTGQVDITFSGSGGSYSILTAAGTIDDSNTAFVFTKLPTELVINGASYIQTGGAITWTWNAGTLTATLSSSVGTGGSIYGRV